MKRKLLFVCFSDDECRLTHALWWANDLAHNGHDVKILFEGLGTRCLTWLEDPKMETFAKTFQEAKKQGLFAGVCQAASSGCAGEAGRAKPSDCAKKEGLTLRNELHGHAGITEFVNQGYEVVVF